MIAMVMLTRWKLAYRLRGNLYKRLSVDEAQQIDQVTAERKRPLNTTSHRPEDICCAKSAVFVTVLLTSAASFYRGPLTRTQKQLIFQGTGIHSSSPESSAHLSLNKTTLRLASSENLPASRRPRSALLSASLTPTRKSVNLRVSALSCVIVQSTAVCGDFEEHESICD